jgi:hypothetical protein
MKMVNEDMKKCSIPLDIREMQIETTRGFHLTPVRLAIIKENKQQQMLVRV